MLAFKGKKHKKYYYLKVVRNYVDFIFKFVSENNILKRRYGNFAIVLHFPY